MFLIILSFILLFILSAEHKLKLREKYQAFSGRFTRYFIDFIAFMLVLGTILAITYFLKFIHLPDSITGYLVIFLSTYALFVILPVRSFDDVMINIFN